jgi:hypothetical protein
MSSRKKSRRIDKDSKKSKQKQLWKPRRLKMLLERQNVMLREPIALTKEKKLKLKPTI